MSAGIYKITNKNDGKVYIGQTNNLARRLAEHKKKRFVSIDDYINVLGAENFNFEVLEECSPDDLDEKEKLYIRQYNSDIDGYNLQKGGGNNSSGEGNGRALLTEQDVYFIREAYRDHKAPSKLYEEYFKDKVTKSQFQAVWQGHSWSYIMPEVYTEENKKFYTSGQFQQNATLTLNEVFQYRKYYINHTRQETWEKCRQDHSDIPISEFLKQRTFERILTGDVRPTSIYKTVPIYKKTLKRWELNGEPVSTIPESWE